MALLRLNQANGRKVSSFAYRTGTTASAVANEAIAFWHEFYAVTALEQLEKKKPQPAGPKLVKRKA